ncbi:hypothetical protein Franean1_2217 [Parafrankia sp. EAN1pec]|nr:hypothetical protein Franean1_2217 [Frankia sp. EAN1pec]
MTCPSPHRNATGHLACNAAISADRHLALPTGSRTHQVRRAFRSSSVTDRAVRDRVVAGLGAGVAPEKQHWADHCRRTYQPILRVARIRLRTVGGERCGSCRWPRVRSVIIVIM